MGLRTFLLQGPIFICKKGGLVTVLDNWFSERQARGMNARNHTFLSAQDTDVLYASDPLDAKTPRGLRARMLFKFCLVKAMRPGEVVQMSLD